MNQHELIKIKIEYQGELSDNPDMHILFTSDKRYLIYCGVCIFSIIESNPGMKIKFHIFSDEYDSIFTSVFFQLIDISA